MNKFQMKMPKLAIALITALVATSSLALWSCASDAQPSDSDIEKALVTQLPAFTRVSKLYVEANRTLAPTWNLYGTQGYGQRSPSHRIHLLLKARTPK